MLYTENYKLNKPELSDSVDIDKLNVNFDILDETLVNKSNKNYIVDGGFQVWKDGTSFTLTDGYTSTMWHHRSEVNVPLNVNTVTKGSDAIYGDTCIVECNVAGGYMLRQPFESDKMNTIQGKTVTLSFWAKSSFTGTVYARVGSIGNISIEPTSQWTYYTRTYTDVQFGDNSLVAGDDGVVFRAILSSGIGVFEVAQVKLEMGDIATEFELETYAEVLKIVEPYYISKNTNLRLSPIYKSGTLTHYLVSGITYPMMRISPTVTITGTSNIAFVDYETTFSANGVGTSQISHFTATLDNEKTMPSSASVFDILPTIRTLTLDARTY